MTLALHLAAGLLLGLLGGAGHLLVTWWRAGMVRRGRAGLALVAFPLGLGAVAAAVLAAAAIASEAAWISVLGVVLARVAVLRRGRR